MISQGPPTSIPSLRRTLGARAIAIAVGNEIQKGLMHAWGERLQILIELPLFLGFFLLLAVVVGRGQQIASGHLTWSFDPLRVSPLLVGYAAFLFLYLQTAKLFWRLLGEIQAGTLEQVYLSPLPGWLVATAGRVLATVLETAALVALIYGVVVTLVPIQLFWRAQPLIPIAFIVLSSVGYSLIEGGLTLVWKRVELLHELLVSLMIFFSGALIPLDRMPSWMADVGRFSPIAQGIVALRAVLVNGQPAFPMYGDGGVLWLVGISLAYLLAGIIAFSLGEAAARGRGSLARY